MLDQVHLKNGPEDLNMYMRFKGWLYSVLGQLGFPAHHERIISVFFSVVAAGAIGFLTWVFS